jgi:hypothetical protein
MLWWRGAYLIKHRDNFYFPNLRGSKREQINMKWLEGYQVYSLKYNCSLQLLPLSISVRMLKMCVAAKM